MEWTVLSEWIQIVSESEDVEDNKVVSCGACFPVDVGLLGV